MDDGGWHTTGRPIDRYPMAHSAVSTSSIFFGEVTAPYRSHIQCVRRVVLKSASAYECEDLPTNPISFFAAFDDIFEVADMEE